MGFFEKYQSAVKRKNSVLCVGLDPVSIFQQDMGATPRKYFEKKGEAEALHDFCLDLIAQTKASACAYKLNAQFALPFSATQLQSLGSAIAEAGAVSIFDNKLSDIGSSNDAALYWVKRTEFDALTLSPFAGNVLETTAEAHKTGLGVFVLALMSNPGAQYFMKDSVVEGKKGYEWIFEQGQKADADGYVVGATNPPELLREAKARAGDRSIFLVPGIGKQGGDAKAALDILGGNVLLNVGRDILNAEDPAQKASSYRQMFNEWLGRE